MNRQIRRGVYETNSSSTHSLTMCSEEEYDKWCSGELLFCEWGHKFESKEDVIKKLKEKYPDVNWDDEDKVHDIFEDCGITTSDEYFDDEYLETFEETYTTPNNEKVIAFGKYGYNG